MDASQQGRRLATLAVATLAWAATAAEAGFTPFDIADPTARDVQIGADANPDPAVVHGSMFPFVVGTWSTAGGLGTVTVGAAQMTGLLMESGLTPVAGTIGALTIEIDLRTGQIPLIHFAGSLVQTDVGDVQFEYSYRSIPGPWTLSSGTTIPGAIGGFRYVQGDANPLFASDAYRPDGSDSPYTAVAGQPYDRGTGLLNAVGPLDVYSSVLGHVEEFDKTFGDIQLTEFGAVPEPASLVLMAIGLLAAVMARRAVIRCST